MKMKGEPNRDSNPMPRSQGSNHATSRGNGLATNLESWSNSMLFHLHYNFIGASSFRKPLFTQVVIILLTLLLIASLGRQSLCISRRN